MISEAELEAGPVVANCCMNRERRLNAYSSELRFSIADFLRGCAQPRWLDLCCGQGRALIEAASRYPQGCYWGVDLVDTFPRGSEVRFVESPLREWIAPEPMDLITCVHGLHYLGDKLGEITRASNWLKPQGRILAHLDLSSIFWSDGKSASRTVARWLRENGWSYQSRYRLLCRLGPSQPWPFVFAGADPEAGPNFTGQPAVNAVYFRKSVSLTGGSDTRSEI